MSVYESIHEFVGDHETLHSVSQYDQMTVILTDTRLVELKHPADHTTTEDVTSFRSIHFSRPSIIGYSIDLGDDRTTICLHNQSGVPIESVTLPERDHRFAVVFSTTIADGEQLSCPA
ncbi:MULTISPECIES: hypothetical protein [Haloferax]|uniref:Uncharacterized protein n=2 Tax=Haloferax TaxID=2251 RepID=A0A6G1Z165_9EURY|nr:MULTISPECIES: hypothetical protein [Haloferax]KAB1187479.1 hypothetical protein Hfx1149_05315 [Haloferax sp. CBA1149]MRW80131.1 hypothetical protein [Haloferax marinisediminis]